MRAQRVLTVLVVTAAVVVSGGIVAVAVDDPAPAARPGPDVINGIGAQLHPEGIVWDPTRKAFLVGSLRKGTVSVVGRDGGTTPLVTDERLVATGGIRVDPARNRLLVTYDDVYAGPDALLSERSTPQTRGRHAGLGIFDLRTGRTIKIVDLGAAPGWHLSNDLAITPDGNAYVTDSFSDTIYRVDTAGNASVFVADPAFQAPIEDNLPNVGLNGVVYDPHGFLLAVRYDTGALFRIPIDHPQDFTQVRLDEPLVGADGIQWLPDGKLVAATNTIRSNGIDGVFVVRGAHTWREGRTVSKQPWPDPAPTMTGVAPYGSYVMSSKLNVLFGSGGKRTEDGFVLRKLDY